MSNHGVTNVGALATFPDTALHLRSVPGIQVHMTPAPAFIVPLPLLLHQLHVKTHHPRLMRNGNVPGANVWHGCARRSIIHRNPASAASHIPTHVSLPLLHLPALLVPTQVPHKCLHFKKQLTPLTRSVPPLQLASIPLRLVLTPLSPALVF